VFRTTLPGEVAVVALTEKAAKEVQRAMTDAKLPAETVLRVGVAGGGCSGFSYKLGFDGSSSSEKDHIVEQHGVKVAIDKKSDLYLDGTTIDWIETLERRGFHFENPNVTRSCGCGSSFSM
jgi:iron-sulfur cluster assembly protein